MSPKKTALAVFVTAVLTTASFADSPLTSTDFAEAYMDEPIAAAAGEANGVINERLMEYLANEYNPFDVKMAVINKLGWQFSGRNNAKHFLDYLVKNHGYSNEKKFYKKGSADELLSYAYLKAMDNYFEVDEALKYADRAVKKNKKSRTFQLIAGLIRAQKTMDADWCEVYQITDRIRKNERLMNDLRTRSVGIIYEYMDIYGDSCEGPGGSTN